MSNSDGWRWQQRLDKFGQALAQLTIACERERYDDLERAGVIKRFEFCFELSWNVLEDLLFHERYDEKVPRAANHKGFEVDYLDENDVAREAETLIKDRYYPVLLRLSEP